MTRAMSVLTRHEILAAIEKREIVFDPQIDAFQLQPTPSIFAWGINF